VTEELSEGDALRHRNMYEFFLDTNFY